MTEARLNDVCRRIADLPSKRLVFERLMQEARRLLLYTGGSANEICYQLGFKDPAYFSRFFQRHAQMTPGSTVSARRGECVWPALRVREPGQDAGQNPCKCISLC